MCNENSLTIEKKLLDIFSAQGIFVFEDEYDQDLAIDSIQFVLILVEIEQVFSIKIEDVYYANNRLVSFNDFLEMTTILIEER